MKGCLYEPDDSKKIAMVGLTTDHVSVVTNVNCWNESFELLCKQMAQWFVQDRIAILVALCLGLGTNQTINKYSALFFHSLIELSLHLFAYSYVGVGLQVDALCLSKHLGEPRNNQGFGLRIFPTLDCSMLELLINGNYSILSKLWNWRWCW